MLHYPSRTPEALRGPLNLTLHSLPTFHCLAGAPCALIALLQARKTPAFEKRVFGLVRSHNSETLIRLEYVLAIILILAPCIEPGSLTGSRPPCPKASYRFCANSDGRIHSSGLRISSTMDPSKRSKHRILSSDASISCALGRC